VIVLVSPGLVGREGAAAAEVLGYPGAAGGNFSSIKRGIVIQILKLLHKTKPMIYYYYESYIRR